MTIKHLLAVTLIAFLFTLANSENWSVTVGNTGKNVYIPASFDANVGDTVTFNFVDGTHDVAQSDEFGKCVKSLAATAFNTPKNVGNAAAPPTATWTLSTAGQQNYFCTVADHCAKSLMYAKINVLAAGTPLKEAGVKAVAPPAAPPAQPASPADDLPNQPKPVASTNPTTAAATPVPTTISSSGSVRTIRIDNQLSVAIALLSLACYFL